MLYASQTFILAINRTVASARPIARSSLFNDAFKMVRIAFFSFSVNSRATCQPLMCIRYMGLEDPIRSQPHLQRPRRQRSFSTISESILHASSYRLPTAFSFHRKEPGQRVYDALRKSRHPHSQLDWVQKKTVRQKGRLSTGSRPQGPFVERIDKAIN